jgi:hypothetical protein
LGNEECRDGGWGHLGFGMRQDDGEEGARFERFEEVDLILFPPTAHETAPGWVKEVMRALLYRHPANWSLKRFVALGGQKLPKIKKNADFVKNCVEPMETMGVFAEGSIILRNHLLPGFVLLSKAFLADIE